MEDLKTVKQYANDLRAGFLEHTRQAYALLPETARPRILDVGCGEGLPTIELARLSGGEVVGIDTDEAALDILRGRIATLGLEDRVSAVRASLYETGFPNHSFDIIWGEGVFHFLEAASCFAECRRALKQGGHLVINDPASWFKGVEHDLTDAGFELAAKLDLPTRIWWTAYYGPLEARLNSLGPGARSLIAPAELAQYEREIAMIKPDPARFDCAFFVARAAMSNGKHSVNPWL